MQRVRLRMRKEPRAKKRNKTNKFTIQPAHLASPLIVEVAPPQGRVRRATVRAPFPDAAGREFRPEPGTRRMEGLTPVAVMLGPEERIDTNCVRSVSVGRLFGVFECML